jgi:hypothetical protein
MDLSPTVSERLARLLPRLASDADGEVVATARALCRTLDRAGLDLNDLAARLTEAPRPVDPAPDLRAMAEALYFDAFMRLTDREADFIDNAVRLLAAGRPLSPKQAEWLARLYATHIKGH